MLDFFPSWVVQQNNTDVGAVDQFSYRKWLQLDSNLNMKLGSYETSVNICVHTVTTDAMDQKMHNRATYQ